MVPVPGRVSTSIPDSGPARGLGCLPLRAAARRGQGAVGVLEVGADEPVELLELPGLPDQQVLGDQVELVGGVDRPAVASMIPQ